MTLYSENAFESMDLRELEKILEITVTDRNMPKPESLFMAAVSDLAKKQIPGLIDKARQSVRKSIPSIPAIILYAVLASILIAIAVTLVIRYMQRRKK